MVRQTLLGRIAIAVNANFDRFRQQTASANRSTRRMGEEFRRTQRRARQFRRELQQAGNRVKTFGSLGATAFAGFAVAEATRNFLAFDRSLTRINTLVGRTREETNAWRTEIIDISRETAISTDQLADGLFNIVSIGQRGTEAMETLRQIARATALGLGDFATVSDTITRIMSAFRSEALQASEAVDVLVATIRLGNDRGEEFTRVFQESVAQAATAGIQIGELGGLFAFLTTSGFTAQRALVGLGQVMATIIRPSIRARDALNSIGLGFQGLREEVLEKGIVRAIRDISDRLEDVGLNIANVFRDKDAVVVASSVANQWERAAGFVQDVAETSQGASVLAFDQLQESTAQRLEVAIANIRRNLEDLARDVVPPLVENFNLIASVLSGLAFASLFTGAIGLGSRLLTGGRALRAERARLTAQNDTLRQQANNLERETQETINRFSNLQAGPGAGAEFDAIRQKALDQLGQRQEILERVARSERDFAFSLGLSRTELVGVVGASTLAGAATFSYLTQTEDAADATERYNAAIAERVRLERQLQSVQEPGVGRPGGRLRFGPGGESTFIRGLEGRLDAARQEEQATRRVADAYRNFGDDAGQAQERIEELRKVADEFLRSNRSRFADAIGDTSFTDLLVGEFTKAFRDLDRATGQQSEEVARRLRSLATPVPRPVDFSQVLPPLRRSAVDDIISRATRATEDAQNALRLSQASAVEREVELETIRLQRTVADELLGIERERQSTNRAIRDAKRSEAADTALVIAEQRLVLDQLDDEEARLRSLLDLDTERGRQVAELIRTRAESNQQLRDDRAAATAQARALAREEERIAERRDTIRAATERAAEFSREIVMSAERELRIAQAAANLRAGGATEAEIEGQVAALEARIDLEERREDLIRRIGRAESDIAIANAEHDTEALEAARLRLEALEIELEATKNLSDEVERLGDIRERIAELSTPVNRVANETERAFMRMEDSLDSFVKAWARGEESVERLVNAMINHIFELFTVRDALSGFGALLSAVFGGGGLISGGAGAASVNFGAPGFRHQGGFAEGFTIVGERGAELVDFQTPSRVYSNNDLASALGRDGGMVVNYAPVIQTSDGAAVRRELARAYPEFEANVRQAVAADLGDRNSLARNQIRR